MTNFVDRDSIVRTIWGDADMVLLVFAGAAAEFALNRAVDCLFFTGRIPNDPRRVGVGLGIPELPASYAEWKADRELHLVKDLVRSEGTRALFRQYRRHLGPWRYQLLLRIQSLLVPAHVRGLDRLAAA